MKVLLTLPRLDSGGVETHIEYLSRGLLRAGVEVVLLSSGGYRVENLIKEGVKFYRLDVKSKNILTLPLRIRKLQRIMEKEGVDLVHAHSRVPAWIGYYAARRMDIPFLTTAHSQYSPGAGSRVMGYGQPVIAVSKTVARHMEKNFGVPPEKLVTVPEGIDVEGYRPQKGDRERVRKKLGLSEEEMIIGNVARFSTLKGHRFLIEAFARINAPGYLLLVGSGRKRKFLEGLARNLSIDRRVIFAGEQKDVVPYLAAMDIYVQSSLEEGLGLAAIEAMAAGVPVVLTRCGGLSEEVEEGREALLVPPGETAPLADRMRTLLEDSALREKIARNGRDLALRRFDIKPMLEETLKVYQRILQGKN